MGTTFKFRTFPQKLIALFVVNFASPIIAECPRGGPDYVMCNGVGLCDVYSRCQCSDGFEGPACELRVCPSGEAWSSPYGVRGPYNYEFRGVHEDAVCSARGICDGTTGRCSCQYGFEGAACERMSCPKGKPSTHSSSTLSHTSMCSGHGLCTNLDRLASEFNFWDYPRPSYDTPWDKEKVHGCLCDIGYTGYDCSIRECAVGDDPLIRNRGEKSDFKRSEFQAWRDTQTTQHIAQNSRDHGDTIHAAKNSEDHVVSDYTSADRKYKSGIELIDEELTNEIQLIYCQAISGWFTLRLGDRVSGHILATATTRDIEEALLELKVGPTVVTFTNNDARTACGGYGGGSGSGGGGGAGAQRYVDNVIAVEFLTLTGRGARMQAFTGESSVPPLELEESRFLGGTGASVSLAHGSRGVLLGQHSVATNRGSHTCSNRGVCGESDGSCICQPGFVASDGLAYGMQGGIRLRHDGLVSTGTVDCGALDQSVFPNYFQDLAAGENGGVASYGGACPGSAFASEGFQCSGHGFCSGKPSYSCTCEAGWEGYDCSLRMCPKARAWFDFPRANNEAHWTFQECSGRGLCDRELGICGCDAGYRGASCDVLDCPVGRVYIGKRKKPHHQKHQHGKVVSDEITYSDLERSLGFGKPLLKTDESSAMKTGGGFTNLRGTSSSSEQKTSSQLWKGKSQEELSYEKANPLGDHSLWELPPPAVYCSGHGVCLSQAEHTARAVDWNSETDRSYGDRVEARTRYSSSFWDADRISGCLCDEGWMGYDCSLQTCPFGDDPNSWGQAPEEQLLRCAAGSGSFTLNFRRFGSDLNIKTNNLLSNATDQDIKKELEKLPTIGEVEVELLNSENSSFCSPRAQNDSLLFFSSPPKTIFTNTTIEMFLKLTSSPSQSFLITLTVYKINHQNDYELINDENEIFIWPKNITFHPNSKVRSTNDLDLTEYFNITFKTKPGIYVIHANTHDYIETNGRYEQWANRSNQYSSILRVFNSLHHIATPDITQQSLRLPHSVDDRDGYNYTLLPGSRSINYTISISPNAKAFQTGNGLLAGRGFDDDGDDDGSRTLFIKPYEVLQTVPNDDDVIGSSTTMEISHNLIFHPSSFELNINQLSYEFYIETPTIINSKLSSIAEIKYEISGNLSSYFKLPSNTGILIGDSNFNSKIKILTKSLIFLPSFLPSIYQGSSTSSLMVTLSSYPPLGTNLTITPKCYPLSKCLKNEIIFKPLSLSFHHENIENFNEYHANEGKYKILKTFQIFAQKSGSYNISFDIGGTAASSYEFKHQEGTSSSSLLSLHVQSAPILKVKFLTEGGDVPPLSSDVSKLSRTAIGSTISSIKKGAFIDVFEDGEQPFSNNDKYISSMGTTESVECSDRGICNRISGICECFDGYRSSDGKGGQGTKGDCGYLAPHVEALWNDQKPPN